MPSAFIAFRVDAESYPRLRTDLYMCSVGLSRNFCALITSAETAHGGIICPCTSQWGKLVGLKPRYFGFLSRYFSSRYFSYTSPVSITCKSLSMTWNPSFIFFCLLRARALSNGICEFLGSLIFHTVNQ